VRDFVIAPVCRALHDDFAKPWHGHFFSRHATHPTKRGRREDEVNEHARDQCHEKKDAQTTKISITGHVRPEIGGEREMAQALLSRSS
jgi:hypothetical protein